MKVAGSEMAILMIEAGVAIDIMIDAWLKAGVATFAMSSAPRRLAILSASVKHAAVYLAMAGTMAHYIK